MGVLKGSTELLSASDSFGRRFHTRFLYIVALILASSGILAVAVVFLREFQKPNNSSALACAPGCHPAVWRHYESLSEVALIASFEPVMPVLSPGFRASSFEYSASISAANSSKSHNDTLIVTFQDSQGGSLIVSQGYPALPGMGLYLTAPSDVKGTIAIGGMEAFWVRLPEGSRSQELFIAALPRGGVMVTWEFKSQGSGYSYSLSSDSMSLAELADIAKTVVLP
jgi:hypothetical protein